MAAVGIGSSLISGALGAAGAATSASASAQSYQYKAGIAGLNSQIALQNQAWAQNSGAIKGEEAGLSAGQQIAKTKVVQAGSGLDINTGSSAAVRSTQTDVAKFDQGTIAADAQHTAYGYEVESVKDTAEAALDTSAASNATQAGDIGILSSIIGATGSVASKWSQANTIGIGSKSSGPIGTFDPSNYGASPSWST